MRRSRPARAKVWVRALQLALCARFPFLFPSAPCPSPTRLNLLEPRSALGLAEFVAAGLSCADRDLLAPRYGCGRSSSRFALASHSSSPLRLARVPRDSTYLSRDRRSASPSLSRPVSHAPIETCSRQGMGAGAPARALRSLPIPLPLCALPESHATQPT